MPIVKTLLKHKMLLDTHVWLFLANGDSMISKKFVKAADYAAENDRLLVAPISIWEIGMLAEKKRITLDKDPLDWIMSTLTEFGFKLVPLSPKIAIESTRLPEQFQGDPADRILMATAREENAILITCDSKLLSYGEDHFLAVHDPKI